MAYHTRAINPVISGNLVNISMARGQQKIVNGAPIKRSLVVSQLPTASRSRPA
jgi:hypothetical protein